MEESTNPITKDDLPEWARFNRHILSLAQRDPSYLQDVLRANDTSSRKRVSYHATKVMANQIRPPLDIHPQYVYAMKKYGITYDQYYAMYHAQDGKCRICGRKPPLNKRATALVVDHDHHTKKVRGLLCQRCNRGIAFFEEDFKLLIQAAQYLNDFSPTS